MRNCKDQEISELGAQLQSMRADGQQSVTEISTLSEQLEQLRNELQDQKQASAENFTRMQLEYERELQKRTLQRDGLVDEQRSALLRRTMVAEAEVERLQMLMQSQEIEPREGDGNIDRNISSSIAVHSSLKSSSSSPNSELLEQELESKTKQVAALLTRIGDMTEKETQREIELEELRTKLEGIEERHQAEISILLEQKRLDVVDIEVSCDARIKKILAETRNNLPSSASPAIQNITQQHEEECGMLRSKVIAYQERNEQLQRELAELLESKEAVERAVTSVVEENNDLKKAATTKTIGISHQVVQQQQSEQRMNGNKAFCKPPIHRGCSIRRNPSSAINQNLRKQQQDFRPQSHSSANNEHGCNYLGLSTPSCSNTTLSISVDSNCSTPEYSPTANDIQTLTTEDVGNSRDTDQRMIKVQNPTVALSTGVT